MHLLKDLCTTGIYDWLTHKGSLMLGKSADSFGAVVEDGLHHLLEGQGMAAPVFDGRPGLDARIREGLRKKDVDAITGLLQEFFALLKLREPEKIAEGFVNGVTVRIKDEPAVRQTMISSNAAQSLLLEILADGKKNHKIRAASILADMRAEAAVPLLHDLLSGSDRELRVTAINAMACLRSNDSIPHVLKALKDEDVHVRWGAVNCLMEIRSRETVQALIDTVLFDADERVRSRAIFALTVMGSPKVADLLTSCSLDNPSEVCRERALKVLEQVKGPSKRPEEG